MIVIDVAGVLNRQNIFQLSLTQYKYIYTNIIYKQQKLNWYVNTL